MQRLRFRRFWLPAVALSSLVLVSVLASGLLTAQPARTGPEIVMDGTLSPIFAWSPTAAAMLREGRVLLAWSEWRRDADRRVLPARLQSRLYDRSGVALGPVRTLFEDPVAAAWNFALSAAGRHGFAAAWYSSADTQEGGKLFARRLDAAGLPAGAPVLVDGPKVRLVTGPFVTGAADGSFQVTWTDQVTRSSYDNDVFVRRFAADGRPRGGVERLRGREVGEVRTCLDVAGRDDGETVVLWESARLLSNTWLHRFDRGGAPVGRVIRFERDWTPLAVAFTPAGGVLVAGWDEEGLRTRVFDADGAVVEETHIPLADETRWSADNLDLVADPDGSFLAIWIFSRGDGSPSELRGVHLSASGVPLGPPGPLLRPSSGHGAASVAALGGGDGGFSVFWTEDGRTGAYVSGIFGQRLATAGAGTLELDSGRYAVSESESGPPAVHVIRRDGTTGTVSVEVAMTGAVRGSATISFGDGDSAPRELRVPVADDAVAGYDRTVHLRLRRPTGGAVLGAVQQAEVEVRDDDAPFPLRAGAGPTQIVGSASNSEAAVGPVTAGDAAGGLVTLWGVSGNAYYQRPSSLLGQLLRANGHRGRSIWINGLTDPGGTAGAPKIARHPEGDFVAAWSESGEDHSVLEPFVQRFDARGAPVGRAFSFGVPVLGLAPLPHGRFVAVGGRREIAGSGLVAWIFDGEGRRIGAPVRVSDSAQPRLPTASVAADAAGRFVVVWPVVPTGAAPGGIVARRFLATGEPAGPAFPVSFRREGYDVNPEVASDLQGNFVVVWQRDWDGDGTGIYLRAFDVTGLAQSPEIPVAVQGAGSRRDPHVALSAEGLYLIAWKDERSSVAAQLRRFPAARLGGDFTLNDASYQASAAWSPARQFVLTWITARFRGEDVKVRRFPLSPP